ncbi:glutathione synthase [Myxococcota bacterium]
MLDTSPPAIGVDLMSLTLAFVMDPIERVLVSADTSFAFMLEAFGRGHRVVHVNPADVHLRGDRVFVAGHDIEVFDREGEHFRIREQVHLDATAYDAIFIRTDPPFDQAYVTLTWLLSFAEKQGVWVINSPRGLRSANEKLYALEFLDLCPRTLVSNSHDEVRDFIKEVGGEAIVKPLDGHGGFGVMCLRHGDSNMHAIVDTLTLEGVQPVMVQEYLPEGASGDKRLFLINGELCGAVLRVPPADDHRSNVHVGGQVHTCEIDARDRVIAQSMSQRLRTDGLFFVGIDVIGGKLIEVNVTSPTLVRELKRLGGPDLAAKMMGAVEKSVSR